MKLRIIEAGWTNFSGDFGGVEFVDNVSVNDVTEFDGFRLSNLIRMETLEGANPSSSQQAIDTLTVPMGSGTPLSAAVEVEREGTKQVTKLFSRAQLEAVADSKGIEGLREIGRDIGVASKSINGLIDLIINQQGGEPKPGSDPAPQGLTGSSKLPSSFEFDGKKISLGSVVQLAFEQYEKAGKTVADWNAQPDELRESYLQAQLNSMRV